MVNKLVITVGIKLHAARPLERRQELLANHEEIWRDPTVPPAAPPHWKEWARRNRSFEFRIPDFYFCRNGFFAS